MKKSIFSIISFVSIIGFVNSATADDCRIGYINLQASPLMMFFNAQKSNCVGDCVVEKYLMATSTGSEALSLEPVELHPFDEASKSVFDLRTTASYGYRPSETGNIRVFFKPNTFGTFKANVLITYGYESTVLGRFRECIQRVYGGATINLLSEVQEMESKGPDFGLINSRVTKVKDKHTKNIDELNDKIKTEDRNIWDLAIKMQIAIEELQEGDYCSQCGNSKSELEPEDFEEHLRKVGGHRVPADTDRIQQKKRFYNDKIYEHKANIERLKGKIEKDNSELVKELTDLENQRQAFIKAFNDLLNSKKRALIDARKRQNDQMQFLDSKFRERKTVTIPIEGEYRAK